MIARYAIGIVALIASAPALAEPLDAAAAQRFVLGKLFAFTCFDGSRGAGRVFTRRLGHGHRPAARRGIDLLGMAAGRNAQGQRRDGLRLAQRHSV